MKTIIKHVFGLMLLSLLAGPMAAWAQAQAELTWDWPQYTMKGEPVNNRSVRDWGYITDTVQYRHQLVYMPYMFPDAPEGQIVNVYLRVYSMDADPLYTHFPPWVFKDFTLKMGYREDSFVAIKYNINDRVPFLRNLTTVFYANTIALNNVDSSYYYHNQGPWLKLPLNAGTFYFRRNQNFAVEIDGRTDSVGHYLHFGGLNFPVRPYPPMYIIRSIGAPAADDSTRSADCCGLASIGFDINPTGVSELSNILGLGLFPNPAPGGR
ncbi:MAG: hypothetical protein JST27_06720, partial [Bacteroidetes bacterium]|nr:hypothetical protein [Bacteroidota bacterium]